MWTTVLLVVHLMIALALCGVVLLQRSEGGALGIGGGGGGFMTGRGTANLLTRTTAVLAAAFFLTSIGLTLLANQGTGGAGGGSVFDRVQVPASGTPGGGAATTTEPTKAPEPAKAAEPPRGGVLDKLEQGGGQDKLKK
jgi:preprotein translocase subunit SecG